MHRVSLFLSYLFSNYFISWVFNKKKKKPHIYNFVKTIQTSLYLTNTSLFFWNIHFIPLPSWPIGLLKH